MQDILEGSSSHRCSDGPKCQNRWYINTRILPHVVPSWIDLMILKKHSTTTTAAAFREQVGWVQQHPNPSSSDNSYAWSLVYSKLKCLNVSHLVAISICLDKPAKEASFPLWARGHPFLAARRKDGTTPKQTLCVNRCCVSTHHLRLDPHWPRSGQFGNHHQWFPGLVIPSLRRAITANKQQLSEGGGVPHRNRINCLRNISGARAMLQI